MRTCSRSPSSTRTPSPVSSSSSTGRRPAGRASRAAATSRSSTRARRSAPSPAATGPVDALLSAVDNALEQIIGGRPQLVDYGLRSDRRRRGCPGRGDRQDRGPDRRHRRPAHLHRPRPIDQRRRGQPAGVPRGRQQAHRRARRGDEPAGDRGGQRRMTDPPRRLSSRRRHRPGGLRRGASLRRCPRRPLRLRGGAGTSSSSGGAAIDALGTPAARQPPSRHAALPTRCCSAPSAVRAWDDPCRARRVRRTRCWACARPRALRQPAARPRARGAR